MPVIVHWMGLLDGRQSVLRMVPLPSAEVDTSWWLSIISIVRVLRERNLRPIVIKCWHVNRA